MKISGKKSTDGKKEHLGPQTAPSERISAGDEATATSSAISGDANREDCEIEPILTGIIERLWSIEQDQKFSLKRTRHERALNRAELAKNLYDLKSLLCGRGRDGAWLPFLRRLRIPRSTAEGLVKSHLAANAKGKHADAPRIVPALTKESMEKLLKALKPRLLPINTRELADHFVRELAVMLDEQIARRTELDCRPDDGRDRTMAGSDQMRDYEQVIPLEAL